MMHLKCPTHVGPRHQGAGAGALASGRARVPQPTPACVPQRGVHAKAGTGTPSSADELHARLVEHNKQVLAELHARIDQIKAEHDAKIDEIGAQHKASLDQGTTGPEDMGQRMAEFTASLRAQHEASMKKVRAQQEVSMARLWEVEVGQSRAEHQSSASQGLMDNNRSMQELRLESQRLRLMLAAALVVSLLGAAPDSPLGQAVGVIISRITE
uniref:Uncharacterized protein n=1 Tax=Chlamydomonas leiostraca TaxID=1034604 RepID=A0A6T8QGC7_9CHLO|mmetsp:Transcript_17930/g.45168  ORF Transcript_17930/g.45168 Transcript_17930/m.45168 type:complete len:213 (+) Transcript_17930:271-909(+)|eukprot:CAMPEP_0202867176 /NCGR_PEP_ID=MMETSP1391-20130828/8865_1 /ASSEMBLY_ACC=CAM_ASM_000867 /TAXON_ID=1034604 /ORGANISM="Chlamydomonas leiostraca, Strain SAG 11-49" /LENGTH=212 /DNA_ID=CAMNT_0049547191 /DNA_START=259 /DNA_END=897 /DNA_ORIENTATION=+